VVPLGCLAEAEGPSVDGCEGFSVDACGCGAGPPRCKHNDAGSSVCMTWPSHVCDVTWRSHVCDVTVSDV